MYKKYINKIIIIFITILYITFNRNELSAISENFKFAIETIGIPRFNKKNQEINEDVYNTYNVFCYSAPEKLTNISEQRWKDSKYGKWNKAGGSYKGKGTRGEYYVLGTNYNGDVIHNYYFPLDVIPTINPELWSFYYLPSALDSWKDKTNYKYIEQLNFMKNTKLLFNDLSNSNNAMNPDKIKTYNITATSIGLDKAKLDTSATWKTNGIVFTRRLISGKIWTAIFLTPPMAANAELKTSLEVQEECVLNENQDEITIPIKYYANIINASRICRQKTCERNKINTIYK